MTVVITGATKGIGRAIAEKFAAAGDNIIVCARSRQDLQKMEEDFAGRFPATKLQTKVVDIGDESQLKEFAGWIIGLGEIPHVLVNSAGYFIPAIAIHSEEEGTLEKMLDINLKSAYHLCRALLPKMMERKSGYIFNICSIASFAPMANVGSYGISKFALLGLTKHLREEMKPFGIKVTAVSPGATFTGSWEGSDINPDRIMKAADIAEMVFAASRLSANSVVEDIVIRPQLGDV